jgi:cytochrome c
MKRAIRAASVVLATAAVLGLPSGAPAAPGPDSQGIEYKVLVFTKSAGERHASTSAGVSTLRALGKQHRFTVVETDDAAKFDDAHLSQYRAVVFLNTSGDVLSDAQQAAFERYFTAGGGFLAIHAAIELEPASQFFTDLLGTRAASEAELDEATIKVADRVHEASKSLPEYWTRTDRFYNFTGNVRGRSHVLATVDESTYAGGTNGADHPVAWCKDYQGGRSFYTAGGHTPQSFGEPDFREHLAGAVAWTAGVADPVYSDCGATVLANYQQTKLSAPPNLDEPIGFDVLPDGRVIQTARLGQVRLHDPATQTSTVIATLPVYTNSEDGLYGPAVDNDFATNHWVYLYYAPAVMEPPYPASTPPGSAPNTAADPSVWDQWKGYFQLSRFKFVDGETPHLDLGSEQKILKVEVNRGACCHVAGDIDFDRDNNLWMVTGDDTPAGGGNSGGFGPFNDQLTATGLFNAPHVDARRSAQNTNDLRGKVLRIKVADDGSYSIPAGNLFPEPEDAGDKTRPEIYAMGFRNPFRIQVDDHGVAYVTDYSPDSQTPQNFRGPAGTGRVEIVRKPANYGWPLCYSPDLPYYRWNFNTSTPLDDPPQTFECGNPAHGPENTSRWNTGRTVTPPVTQPDVWYSYRDNTPGAALGTPCFAYYNGSGTTACPQLFPELGTGGVGPHGAARYSFDPDNPNPAKLPPYYDGAIFFGEFTRDYLKEVRLDASGRIFKINGLFDCGQVLTRPMLPFECDNPMDMQFGTDGAFYLLTYGDGFFAANPDAGMYRFDYVKGLRAPQAVVSATPTSGQAPLTVQFSSEGTRDPDPGESITYAWDFDGNGSTDSIDPSPSHTYTGNGVYQARLTVKDSSGKTDSKTTTVTVGNTAPTVNVTVPVEGGTFAFGEGIPFTVSVSDPEDGAIDCGRVKVTFVLGHDTHGHAEADTTGCSGVLPTVADDVSHGGNVFGVVSASYTDDPQGAIPALTTTDQNPIRQKRQEVEHVVEQSGTNTATTADVGGGLQRGSLGNGDWLRVNGPFDLTGIDAITFRTSGGSGASGTGLVELHRDAVDGPVVETFTIAPTANATTYASQTFPLTDPGGLHQLFLVFRPAAGGPTNNFFNLNWVEFNGPGISVNAA